MSHAATSPASPLHGLDGPRAAATRLSVRTGLRALVAAGLLAAFAFLWFAGLGARLLAAPDEARYGEIAAEMAATHDWVTPRLDGLKYFEKPPLQAWATASLYRVAGTSEAATRLFPALAGLLAVIAAGLFATALAGRTAGIASAAILAGAPLAFGASHYVTLDSGVSGFLAVATFAFALAQRDEASEQSRTRWMLLAWLMAALAVLAKGLIGVVLPGLAVVAYVLVDRRWSVFARLRPALGLPLFLAIAAPWFVAVSIANPEFPRFFFVEEHFARYAASGHQRAGAWWYFVPVLVAGLLPWTPLVPAAMRAAWRREKSATGFSPLRFLAVWAIVVVAFFSISHSKLPAYVLPAWPAIAVILGVFVTTATRRALNVVAGTAAVTGAVTAALALTVLPKLAPAWIPRDLFAQAGPTLALAAAGLVLGGALAWRFARRDARLSAVVALASGALVFGHGTLDALGVVTPALSSANVVRELASHIDPATPVFAVRHLDQSEAFYLGRPVILVEDAGEAAPGARWEPGRFVADMASFEQRWRALPAAAAIVLPPDYERLVASGLPMEVVAQDRRRIAIVKTPHGAHAGEFDPG